MAKKSKVKKWYNILAPEMFGKVEIGHTSTNDPDTLINRKVNVSLMSLINDFKKYYIKFSFKVVSVDENNAYTEFDGSQCLSDYITRMVLKYSRRVDTVQDLTTKDGVKVRVKGLGVIRSRVKSSIKGNIRNSIRDTIKREVEKETLEGLIEGIISDKIKSAVLKEARKIYPIRSFEIRKTEML